MFYIKIIIKNNFPSVWLVYNAHVESPTWRVFLSVFCVHNSA